LGPLDTPLLITTGSAAASVFDTLTLLLCFLVLFYTVESLVREERCGLSAIFRAEPVPTASVLAGKVLANAAMALVIIGCASLAIAMVLGKQALDTEIAIPFDVPVLFLILGVLLTPTLIVRCVRPRARRADRNRFRDAIRVHELGDEMAHVEQC
jgi:ABC-type transport system involved in multi-copper enzyme maturation permease subunit